MSAKPNFTRPEILAVLEASRNGERVKDVAVKLGRKPNSVGNVAKRYGYPFGRQKRKWREQMARTV